LLSVTVLASATHLIFSCAPSSLAKTEVMIFERRRGTAAETVVRVGGVPLRTVTVFKYLGVLVSCCLGFSSHATRVKERARAAAIITSQLISRLGITNFKRLAAYYSCYVESQFYGLEIMPCSVLECIKAVRSQFIRSVFDLPRSTSHELAVILLDLTPVEVLLLRRRKRFFSSVKRHEFSFVRDICSVDQDLIQSTLSWHHATIQLLHRIDPSVSTVDLLLDVEFSRACDLVSDPDFNFYFIQDSDSESLSFFRLFESPQVLSLFRCFLQSLSAPRRRLVILFCSSLLRFRFCPGPREFCPLCGKVWLWEHFFSCRHLTPVPDIPGSDISLNAVKLQVSLGQWDIFLHYLRFFLLEWHDVLSQVVFPFDIIDELC
jgi:hypothetical protein